ncbi:MFS transporter [Saccharopolyspora mangrovi]|uniref:MFS transporter n=1 Tax=Saccharopolyspora mangrovi TaxID=3082379 RepID=A0ABU6A5F7_9PSEU|nr:MFS transporter [Saccharopolyspora sp. S2-29]MEB3366692.1 MFS transporter [Saccharopolyspora sp. S2-29]
MTNPALTARDWTRSTVAGMASYLDAAAIVSTGTALVLFQDDLGLDPLQIGVLSSLLTLSIAAGALTGGRLGDRFGRRTVFSLTMVLLALGAGLLAAAAGPVMLCIGVVLIGYASGADLPVSLALIAEEAPPGQAGKLVGLSQVLWFGGIIATQLLSIVVGDLGSTGGRLLYAHVAVVAVLVLLLRLRVPESAKWVASREQFSGTDPQRKAPRLRELATSAHLLPLLGLITFYALVNVVANTKGQFGTFLYVNVAGSTVSVASTISVVTQCLGVALALLFMKVVDGRNRLRWYLFGAACYIVAMAIVVLFGVTVWSLATSAIFSAIGGALAFEAMLKVWCQEAFPTLLRATAQGTVVGAARVVAAGAAAVTPMLMTNAPRATFAVLLGVVTAGLIAGLFVGRSVQQHNHLRDDDTRSATAVGDPAQERA